MRFAAQGDHLCAGFCTLFRPVATSVHLAIGLRIRNRSDPLASVAPLLPRIEFRILFDDATPPAKSRPQIGTVRRPLEQEATKTRRRQVGTRRLPATGCNDLIR
jgi:hypothetical protein